MHTFVLQRMQGSKTLFLLTLFDVVFVPTIAQYITTLSLPRYYLTATSVGNLALFAGGYDGPFSVSSQIDIYNLSSNEWTTTTLSTARYDLAATSVGSIALFGGGGLLNTSDSYIK